MYREAYISKAQNGDTVIEGKLYRTHFRLSPPGKECSSGICVTLEELQQGKHWVPQLEFDGMWLAELRAIMDSSLRLFEQTAQYEGRPPYDMSLYYHNHYRRPT